MFTSQIIDSDAFQDMPLSAQALYFHLGMKADDDGFLGNPKRVQKMIGASEDDMKLLLMKKFIYLFDTGICVIKHWKMHNYIQKDRYKPTAYEHEKDMLELKKNKAYTVKDENCIQNGYILDTNCTPRLGKVRLGKVSEDILSETDASDDVPTGKEDIKDNIPYKEIIDYLNKKAGTQYRYKTKKTKKKIEARYNEGFAIDDFKKVIDIKCDEWLSDPKMCKYIRPETLFGNKFESYLNKPIPRINNNQLPEWYENQDDVETGISNKVDDSELEKMMEKLRGEKNETKNI